MKFVLVIDCPEDSKLDLTTGDGQVAFVNLLTRVAENVDRALVRDPITVDSPNVHNEHMVRDGEGNTRGMWALLDSRDAFGTLGAVKAITAP